MFGWTYLSDNLNLIINIETFIVFLNRHFVYISIFRKLIEKMPKAKHKELEISQEDCPTEVASKYPGIFRRNNPNGSLLSKDEFIECSVKAWVLHFGGSEKYENTSLSKKYK